MPVVTNPTDDQLRKIEGQRVNITAIVNARPWRDNGILVAAESEGWTVNRDCHTYAIDGGTEFPSCGPWDASDIVSVSFDR